MFQPSAMILDEVLEIARVWNQRKESVSRLEKQSRARWDVLRVLGSGKTVPQIARQLRVSRQSVQRIADRLSEEGALRFALNPDHKRSPILRPTEQGVRLRERLDRGLRGWDSALAELAETEDLETALLVLRALRAALEE